MRIELDRELSGGFLRGRHDLWVCGGVSASEPVEQVSLQVGHHVFGKLLYGQVGAAKSVVCTRRTIESWHYAFAFGPNCPAAETALPSRFSIVTVGEEGTASEDFVVSVGHGSDPAGGVGRQGPTSVAASETARAPIILFVEWAVVDPDGQLHIQGWALLVSPIVAIRIFANETRVGTAQLGRSRPDVAGAHPEPECRYVRVRSKHAPEQCMAAHITSEYSGDDPRRYDAGGDLRTWAC